MPELEQYMDQQQKNGPSETDATAPPASMTGKPKNVVLTKTTSASKYPQLSLLREVSLITVVCASQFVALAGLAQSIAPLRKIGQSLKTSDVGELSWFPAAFSLTVGCFILPAGRWGDLYGHKNLFIFGYAWYAVWSLVAGFSIWARSVVVFALFRALQGIGPAILLPNGIAILARTYPAGRRKEVVLSFFGAAAPTGFVAGAAFTGLFAELVWWPWAYWIHGIVLANLAWLATVNIPKDLLPERKHPLRELDLGGTVLGVTGLTLFNFAWNEGPAVGWDEVYVYVLLIVGVAVLGMFFYYEVSIAAYPLLPVHAFITDTNLVLGCIAAGWASFGIWIFYLW